MNDMRDLRTMLPAGLKYSGEFNFQICIIMLNLSRRNLSKFKVALKNSGSEKSAKSATYQIISPDPLVLGNDRRRERSSIYHSD